MVYKLFSLIPIDFWENCEKLLKIWSKKRDRADIKKLQCKYLRDNSTKKTKVGKLSATMYCKYGRYFCRFLTFPKILEFFYQYLEKYIQKKRLTETLGVWKLNFPNLWKQRAMAFDFAMPIKIGKTRN